MMGIAVLGTIIGAIIGVSVTWVVLLRSQQQKIRTAELGRQKAETELQKERETHAEKVQALENVRAKIDGEFQRLMQQSLEGTSDRFFEQARRVFIEQQEQNREGIEGLVKPVRESLQDYNEKFQKRMGELGQELKQVVESTGALDTTTSELVNVLQYEARTRGQWGENQLRRILEMSGMTEHIDFETQVTVQGDDGKQRPDAVIHLPGARKVVVDAKVSLAAYLGIPKAETEEERERLLVQHARQLKEHVKHLGSRAYWSSFDDALDFVVMFVPGDSLVSAAFEKDANLLDFALSQNVIITTPTTMLALAKAIAFGWRQEVMSSNAREVLKIGSELYDRFNRLSKLLSRVSNRLASTVEAHNSLVASFESRALPSARRMNELHVSQTELEEVAQVDTIPRNLTRTTADVVQVESIEE